MSDSILKLKNNYDKVAVSKYFPILVAIFVFFAWFFGFEKVGTGILLFVCGLLLATCKDSTNALSILLMFIYSFNKANRVEGNMILIVFGIFFIIGAIIHFVRFKPKTKHSNLTIPLALFALSIALGGITLRSFDNIIFYIIIAISIVLVIVYLLFNMTIQKSGEELADYLCHFLLILGMLVTVQVAVYYMNVEDIEEVFYFKRILLGWGSSNNIGAVFCLTIPASMYFLLSKSYFKYIAAVLVMLQCVALLLTLSRGSILAIVIAAPILFIYVAIKSHNKKAPIFILLLLIVIMVIMFFALNSVIQNVIAWLKNVGMSDRGRFDLYKEAFKCFKDNPLFGVGMDYKIDSTGNKIYWFHNTYFEALGKLGIFGLLNILLFNGVRYMNALKVCKNKVAVFLIASVICFEFYGLVDTNFFSPIHLAFLLIVNIAFERMKNDKIKEPDIITFENNVLE